MVVGQGTGLPPDTDLDLGPVREIPSLAEMLDAIPLDVQLAVDEEAMKAALDGTDPSITDSGRRICIAVRRAGGRCTASAPASSLLCNMHSGVVDPAAGGRALAEKRRNAATSEAEVLRMVRVGARGVVAERLHARPLVTARVVDTLMDMAASGDVTAAKALVPWMNQGLGMPTETVHVTTPESLTDLERLGTADLAAYVAQRRALRAAQATEQLAAEHPASNS